MVKRSSEEKRERRFWLKRAVRVAFPILAAGALVWLLHHIGWAQLGRAVSAVGWTGGALLLVLGFAENMLDAAALRACFPTPLGFYRILSYNGAGAIINNLLPGDVGEVLKASLLKKHGTFQDAISGTVLWNYIFKCSRPAAATTAAVTSLLTGQHAEPAITWIVLGATLLAFAPYLGLKILVRKGMAGLAVRVLEVLRFIRKNPDELTRAARELDHRIRRFWRERPYAYLQVWGFQFLARITAWITLYTAVRLVGLDYSFGLCALIYAGFSVASYIVMMLPARLGVGEGAGYLIFSLLGLDGAMGVIVYLVLRVKALVTNGLPAIFRP